MSRRAASTRNASLAFLMLVVMTHAVGAQNNNEATPASPPAATNQRSRPARKLYVHSGTVYLTSSQVKDALKGQAGFSSLGLEVVDDPAQAELDLYVNRPLMTFDWVYTLTDRIGEKALASGKVESIDGGSASSKIALEVMKHLGPLWPTSEAQVPTARSEDVMGDRAPVLQTFHKYFVKSGTIYLKSETLQHALESRREVKTWGLEAVDKSEKADVIVDVTLPFLTWEWKYQIVDISGHVLAGGKTKALTGDIAAPQIAESITQRILAVRPASSGRATVYANRRLPPGKEWHVDFVGGSQNVNVGKGTLTTGLTDITCRFANKSSLTIPAQAVFALEHSTEKTHADWKGATWGVVDPNGTDLYESYFMGPIFIPVFLAVDVAVEAMPATQYVRIDWKENGLANYVVAQTSNYQALIKEIALITNTKGVDIPAEIKRVRQALLNSDAERWSIKLDRPAMVGWTELPKGVYEVVYLQRQDQLLDVYFLPSPTGPASKPLAQAVVQMGKRDNPRGKELITLPFADVQYTEENGITRITAISKGDRSWLFNLVPLDSSGEK